MSPSELTGQTRGHIAQFQEPRFAAHPLAVKAFVAMQEKARGQGLELAIFSGFRDFETQRKIWQTKATGQRPLYDPKGQEISFDTLGPDGLIEAILRWSALPGASRHHWGSDLDLIDLNGMPLGYRVQLLPDEYAPGGVFGKLNFWLTQNIREFEFFQPYLVDRGGVSPEPWHLSFAPVSVPALAQMHPQLLKEAWGPVEMVLKDRLLERLEELFERYVTNINPP
ncbi:MAG: hypothetical protein A2600_02580 [Candidatus Lambdaproteobacteria bacterium RIFOXYD1_FULL_56_27]|uniref:D-alanyl-D-alanine carboxypeptidase-like core domain-containing protein n=1 Tax=Candidatus Lambdaproteobacteria bacterium RIFOXYD2_FULL_56_26 TaxID=1817773 RepID=A0A1F6H2Q1_9PROT|nr:MAG: hypothetical protein A2426_09620 [Candidatus Lambdaproteobacteria bacterium RIFOXYC1_FULL_56_13]OGH04663.1 MAG: hypothetical protein A2557_06645 [Candidatus Lambdaproteobacteria bacterium RIFOXYD2_FULL_56_26]OGH09127.1 MAG: hypothetical protein A2600_02580 [Candidatus Lambdaproteobacteria bacterium RIFOXYD1_FULL_56_27]